MPEVRGNFLSNSGRSTNEKYGSEGPPPPIVRGVLQSPPILGSTNAIISHKVKPQPWSPMSL